MKHIFIVNPQAGKMNASEQISKNVHDFFQNRLEDSYRIETTSYPLEAIKIAKRYCEIGEKVILYACGGDGTLNEVLNGCIGYDNAILAHIPIGTGNDFIKYFGRNAKKDFLDIQSVIDGNVVEVDVLDVGGRYSLNIANIGLDAMIAANANKFKRMPLVSGKGAYQLSLAYSFFTSTSHKMKLIVDGVEEEKDTYTFVVCANAKYYGGNYCAAPFADIQDGYLDVILIPKIARSKILQLMKVYEKGEHLNGKYRGIVIYHKAKKVEIHADYPLQLCLEGEIISLNNPTIQISNKKIKLLVPKKYTRLEKLIEA